MTLVRLAFTRAQVRTGPLLQHDDELTQLFVELLVHDWRRRHPDVDVGEALADATREGGA